MKTFFTFLFIVLSLTQHIAAQALHIDSTRFISGNKVGTSIYFAIPTADKGILFVGSDYGNPGGIIPYFSLDTGVNGNVLIGKIDSNHQVSWIKVFGGTDADAGTSVCQTPDGGYAVLAGTASNNGDVTGYRGGSGDFWLLRLDASGNLLWEKTYGSSAQDAPMSIANTPHHGFIMSGVTNGSDGDVPFHYGDFFSFDWLVIKTDSLGNVQWSKDIGGTGDEGDNGSILAIDGSYYLIGGTDSKDYDCTDSAWHVGVNTKEDYHILKLNDTGKVLWDSSYGGTDEDGAYYAMFDTRDSTIVINGFTNSSDYMVTGYQGGQDMWVIKVNKNGTLIWQKTLGSTQEESGTGICAGQNDGYAAIGTTYVGPIGGTDAWVFVLSSAGNIIGNKNFGGTDNDNAYSIVPYLNGYVAAGTSASSVFTEGSCNVNYSGAFVSYLDSGTLAVHNVTNYSRLLKIFPNPASEEITIIIPEDNSGTLTFINGIGQTIDKKEIRSNTKRTNVNINEWANGLYIVKWKSENGTVLTTRFIKN